MAEMAHTKDLPTKCDHCGMELLPCPFCGSRAVVFGDPSVGCAEFECGATIDFGHWVGVEDGVPAYHWVIEQWNKRFRIKGGTDE